MKPFIHTRKLLADAFDKDPSKGLRAWIGTRRWGILPAPLWALIAAPLLTWAFGVKEDGYFRWPHNISKSPFNPNFWRVDYQTKEDRRRMTLMTSFQEEPTSFTIRISSAQRDELIRILEGHPSTGENRPLEYWPEMLQGLGDFPNDNQIEHGFCL